MARLHLAQGTAESFETLFLQEAKDLRLRMERHVADFVGGMECQNTPFGRADQRLVDATCPLHRRRFMQRVQAA